MPLYPRSDNFSTLYFTVPAFTYHVLQMSIWKTQFQASAATSGS